MVYCTEVLPSLNFISCCSAHIRSAGCTREQAVGILLANAAAYIQLGVDAGLDVDAFMRQFTFLGIGGSIEMLKEVAANRALRRMFAKMMKERFGAKNARTMMTKTNLLARTLEADYTIQRPLNNLTRSVIGGIAAALVGGTPSSGMGFPWDEPLGLGHSNEAWQLHRDAARIIQFESGIGEALDPLAGSYYVESLTDDIEKGAWDVYNKIESLGGSLKAIETGWMQREVARAAYKQQKDVETCEKKLRRDRDNDSVKKALQRMQEAAKDEDVNLMPHILEAVKAYATIGEMCDALRNVFGEYRGFGVI